MSNNLNEKPKQSKGKSLPHLQILDSTLYESSCLSNGAFRVYIMLRVRRNRKTGQLDPGVPRIMKDTGLGKKTVERALNELESLGWIFRKNNKGKPNDYSFPESAITIKIPQVEQPSQGAAASSSNGTPPPAATGTETDAEYLNRKQLEFPRLDVKTIFADFKNKCGSEKYPKMKNTRRKFDQWLENEGTPISDEEFQAAFGKE
jgi:hypothetical protein